MPLAMRRVNRWVGASESSDPLDASLRVTREIGGFVWTASAPER